MKCFNWAAVLAVSILLGASSASADSVTVPPSADIISTEISPGNLDQPKSRIGDTKKVDFVLAEVRKVLEPNPESQVIELSIDPDYVGAEDSYLVNVVIEAHEQKLLLGVLVTLRSGENGWETTFGFVD
jgi:hypothetical protein